MAASTYAPPQSTTTYPPTHPPATSPNPSYAYHSLPPLSQPQPQYPNYPPSSQQPTATHEQPPVNSASILMSAATNAADCTAQRLSQTVKYGSGDFPRSQLNKNLQAALKQRNSFRQARRSASDSAALGPYASSTPPVNRLGIVMRVAMFRDGAPNKPPLPVSKCLSIIY